MLLCWKECLLHIKCIQRYKEIPLIQNKDLLVGLCDKELSLINNTIYLSEYFRGKA